MLLTETALGRVLPPGTSPEEEQRIVLRDLVLKVLFDSWRSPFNPDHHPLAYEALERITLIEPDELAKVVAELSREKLIIKKDDGVSLTQLGFAAIQSVPHWSAAIAP